MGNGENEINVFGSSDRRLKVGNFRPISRAQPLLPFACLRRQFNRGWDTLNFCSTNPNYPREDNILFLSLHLHEFERNPKKKHFLSPTCYVRTRKVFRINVEFSKIRHCANSRGE